MINPGNLFQYCSKFVIFNQDFSKVLLCERKGEADYNHTYSFAGGKIENIDNDIRAGMQREKLEELGKECEIVLYKNISTFEYFIKNDGTHMILPHHICIYRGGEININDEYSDYKRININELETCGLKLIPTIIPVIKTILPFCNSQILDMSESIRL